MNINLKSLLLGTSLVLIPNLLYAQCAETDCLKLGYTKLEKCDNGLKCPFGEYWACPKVEEKAVLGECTGYAKNCKIADILNSDGTCTTDKISGKSPIGVVIAIKDNCGWAMTASPIESYIKWSTKLVETGIGTTTNLNTAIKNFDACANTQKITKLGDSSQYPAAWAAVNYAPNSSPATKGKWCLPAPGILNSLYKNMKAISNTISKLGGTQMSNFDKRYYERIWSSSEYNANSAWGLDNITSSEISASRKNFAGGDIAVVVRPVITF